MLADGGIETRIVYEFKRPIENFNASLLLDDAPGREMLRTIYASYADIAARYGLPMQLGSPTWRASRRWIPSDRVRAVNRAAVELIREVAAASGATIAVAGVLGPASDGYDASSALGEEEAFRYHREQAQALADAGVDLLYAPTFPARGELCGAARAMADTGKPYALAPMLHPDGTMIDGTPLDDAVSYLDATVSPKPDHYMIGCLYPTHALSALEATRARHPAALERVAGLKANASPLSPEELTKLDRLAATPPDQFARDLWTCARAFGLRILGGCCGTDDRDIEAIAALRTV